MLQKINEATVVHPCRSSRNPSVITFQSVAKARHTKRERARLAAQWVANQLTIVDPTVTLAVKVFGVSQPLVNQELAKLSSKTALEGVWDALDHLTS
jgi:hypothetical protein